MDDPNRDSPVVITTAMVLAAGEGQRMRPLTLTTPKPLLSAGGKTLIEWQLEKLKVAGITRVVVNVSYLGKQIMDYLGNGRRFDLELCFSPEPEPLETGGALHRALDQLGKEPFLLVNGDVWTDFPLQSLVHRQPDGGHLLMIANPPHHPQGDFCLQGEQLNPRSSGVGEPRTFSGISVINPLGFARYPQRRERFPLKEVFDWWMQRGELTGESYDGSWMDIGTPERLEDLRDRLGPGG